MFRVNTAALPADTILVGLTGTEALARPYHFEVYVSVAGKEVDASGARGQKATVTNDAADPPFVVHGILSEAEVVEIGAERTLVRLKLVPRLQKLASTRHSRVFTNQSIPDIVGDVLEKAGLSGSDVRFVLNGSYDAEEHVTQHRESDLAFITRWLEHEGMYYFFEQGESAETLVITDDKSTHTSLRSAPVRYRSNVESVVPEQGCFELFTARTRIVPGKVKLKDYDYARPSLDVSGESKLEKGAQLTEVVEHGARFFDPARGKALARIRSEELASRQREVEARGPVAGLRAGYLFEVEEHPRPELNEKFLCTSIDHLANPGARTEWLRQAAGLREDRYVAHARGIPADVQYRAERKTQQPRIAGTERALIDGPSESEYAQLDEAGRYKLKFGFDESDLKDGKASTAVRMAQPHAGVPEGFHFPLRKGTEVAVAFLGGHPDRPVIAGALPNQVTPSPVTSSNHTRNILHTGSDNHVEIEDEDGKQWIDFRTPPKDTFLHLGKPHDKDTHYIVLNTQGDCLFNIGGNQDISVGANLTEKVEGAVLEHYDSSQTSDVQGPQITMVDDEVEEDYSGGAETTVQGPVLELYQGDQTTTVSGGDRDEVYDASQMTLVACDVIQNFDDSQELTNTGPTMHTIGGDRKWSATGTTTYDYDSAVIKQFGPTTRTSGPTTWNVPGGIDVYTGSWTLVQQNRSSFDQAVTEMKIFRTKVVTGSLAFGAFSDTKFQLAVNANAIRHWETPLSFSLHDACINLQAVVVEITLLEIAIFILTKIA